MRNASWLWLALAASACATAPKSPCRAAGAGMSLEEAQAIATEFESNHLGQDPNNPLREPKSLDDVLEILKSDELDLFPAGVSFASKQPGVQAKALAAQIELAWGEAELTLADLFSLLASSQAQTP